MLRQGGSLLERIEAARIVADVEPRVSVLINMWLEYLKLPKKSLASSTTIRWSHKDAHWH